MAHMANRRRVAQSGNSLMNRLFAFGSYLQYSDEDLYKNSLFYGIRESMAHWLGVTSEENWPKCLVHGVWGASENRFRALQQMKIGDDLLVYLKPMKIVGIFQITKEYFHDSTRIWRDGLLPHRVGFQPKPSKVPLKGIEIRSLYNSYFKSNKGSPRGYFGMGIRRLPEEEFTVFEAEIDKNKTGKTGAEVFLTGYPEANLEISKKQQILGWERNPKDISIGDLVFVYNKNSKKIECGFRIKSKSNRTDPVWEGEINANPPQQKYSFRWDAEPICHDLNIDYNTICRIEPFRPNNRGKKASFYILVTRNSANSLRNPIYRPFRDYLLNKCGNGMNKKDEIGWSFDIEKAVDEILLVDTERELAIDRQLVKRILIHLKAGKHVILVGPPGVGKTDLARRMLGIIGKKVIGNDSFLESVASDEWSRYEIIGGVNLANEFQEGWVTKAAVDNKWLLIDEFNRTNMNKAFGELFLAVEYSKITLRPTESKSYKKDAIEIPQNFRMICTMNDFDKNLLLTELSYGLISRFAFVPITPDIQREPKVVERRVKSLLGSDDIYKNCIEQIKLYFEFINHVRGQRNIGVRTSLDIVKYIISATKDENNTDDNYKWVSLNNALCDYVLPQFDRLDSKTIAAVLTYANSDLIGEAFKPLREELEMALSRLQKATGWLTNKDGI